METEDVRLSNLRDDTRRHVPQMRCHAMRHDAVRRYAVLQGERNDRHFVIYHDKSVPHDICRTSIQGIGAVGDTMAPVRTG